MYRLHELIMAVLCWILAGTFAWMFFAQLSKTGLEWHLLFPSCGSMVMIALGCITSSDFIKLKDVDYEDFTGSGIGRSNACRKSFIEELEAYSNLSESHKELYWMASKEDRKKMLRVND